MPRDKQAEATNKKSAEQREAAIQRAVELYKSLASSNPNGALGYRAVCKLVEEEFATEKGVKITLCYNTVRGRVNGMFNNLYGATEYLIPMEVLTPSLNPTRRRHG